MVSRNTILVPSLGLHSGSACEAGLSVGMRRKRVPPQRIKIKKVYLLNTFFAKKMSLKVRCSNGKAEVLFSGNCCSKTFTGILHTLLIAKII